MHYVVLYCALAVYLWYHYSTRTMYYVQRMHLLINSLVTMLRLEEEEAPDALAAAYEPFVGFAPADSEA